MKLLLIQPPIQDFYDTDVRLQPIGLCYLKAAVNQHVPDCQVKILDFHQGHSRQTIEWPQELRYLKEYYRWPDQSPFCTFHSFFHFGASFEVIVQAVLKEAPDAIGISSLFSPYYREVLKVADLIKAVLPQVPIIVGGSHVSAVPESMLGHPSVDFVIRGEGERPLVAWLEAWSHKSSFAEVPNLGYKNQAGQMVFTSLQDNWPMEQIPAPQLNDLALDQYLFEKKPMSFVITSRSCPHRCSFCSVHKTFGTKYRRKSVEHVLAEIIERYQLGYRVFDFEDDNLTFYKKEFAQLCEGLIEHFPAGSIQCVAMNGISYLSLDQTLLHLMKRAGFTHLNLALVSSDTTVRETTKRPHTIEKYLEVVEMAFALEFKITSYQILGLPNETLDSMIQTLCFNAQQPVLLGASPFYLTPNSPIAQSFPPATPTDIFKSRLTAFAIETENFKRQDIYTLLVITRIINFFKSFELSEKTTSFKTLLARSSVGLPKRTQIGLTLLNKLEQEQKLYAATAEGFKPLTQFSFPIWQQVKQKIGHIRTQQGHFINFE